MTSTRLYTNDKHNDGAEKPKNNPPSNPDPNPSSNVGVYSVIVVDDRFTTDLPDLTLKKEKKKKKKTLRLYQIHTPLLFDSIERVLVKDQVVSVDKDRGVIVDVSPADESVMLKWIGLEVEVEWIEMEKGTVLVPGFVDVHVHLFLHPYTETSWEDQVTRESLAERTVRATVHAKRTLLAGFTTVRDLGTEGAFDADIGLRKCMAGRNPIIPGPRYYCATRAIVTTGAYGPKNRLYPAQDGVDGVVGAVPVDGVDDCVREVRRQIGAGADWIKIYADYSPRSPILPVSQTLATRTIATFNRDELKAMVQAAHRWGVKVAVHANTPGAIDVLLKEGGPDSVEHGGMLCLDYDGEGDLDGESGKNLKDNNTVLHKLARAGKRTTWVPTLAAYYTMSLTGTKHAKEKWEMCKRTFEIAVGLEYNEEESKGNGKGKGKKGKGKGKGKDNGDDKKDFDSDGKAEKTKQMDNIAVGGDTGVFAHGENALEMVLMRRLGAGWERVLGWATYGGWKCVRGMEWEGRKGEEKVRRAEGRARELYGYKRKEGEAQGEDDDDDDEEEEELQLDRDIPFGAICGGWAADLVGIKGKVDGTPEEFERALMHGVQFVMKGGVVYKRDGREVSGY